MPHPPCFTNQSSTLVAILNCTPDSFFSLGRHSTPEDAIHYGLQMFEQGADILDIGGESTRPDSDHVLSEEEEVRRVIPVIQGIRKYCQRPLSIDTFKPAVAEAALAAGVTYINDITGFQNADMRLLARKKKAKCIVMHMYGAPHTSPNPIYPRGVVCEVENFLAERVNLMLSEGICSSQIIIDPGIGGGAFGKSPTECLEILHNLKTFVHMGYPVLIGISRKSFMQTILQKPASEVLSTTLALNTMALLEGVRYIRVHDVIPHKDMITILQKMNRIDKRELNFNSV